ncbi:hypothetical protein B0H16DRAFT_1480062 [Mycena metata]|uniref:Uncharacterized protein n=1 Tax=Mycena metata TaxID=1033252 RepID=A0AAD7H3X3_9AGAR|nr:hypothetical protein B0H16DRAFT_1480062 [Mycena metata]
MATLCGHFQLAPAVECGWPSGMRNGEYIELEMDIYKHSDISAYSPTHEILDETDSGKESQWAGNAGKRLDDLRTLRLEIRPKLEIKPVKILGDREFEGLTIEVERPGLSRLGILREGHLRRSTSRRSCKKDEGIISNLRAVLRQRLLEELQVDVDWRRDKGLAWRQKRAGPRGDSESGVPARRARSSRTRSHPRVRYCRARRSKVARPNFGSLRARSTEKGAQRGRGKTVELDEDGARATETV